jgi:disulfide bond formation protein DsbB
MENKPNLGDWNMSDEREFMENLLCQRFNFFLVMFSLILAAAFTARPHLDRTLILATGVILSVMVWLTLYRAHVKHHWIMQHLYGRPEHPAAIVNTEVKKQGRKSFRSVSWFVGVGIPLLCVLVLLVFTVISAIGWFEDTRPPRMPN